jgi:hypothetical protein
LQENDMSQLLRALARGLRVFGRIVRMVVLCLGALGPGAPPPPPAPRRQQEVQIAGEPDDEPP